MKQALAIFFLMLLGACVLHQARPVVDEGESGAEVAAVEFSAPEGLPEQGAAIQAHASPVDGIESPVPDDHYAWGLKAIASGQYEAAISLLSKAVESDPGDATASYALGFAYLKLGEYQDAVWYFTRSQANARTSAMEVKGLVGRGYALHALGRFDQAVRAYGVALQINPDSVKALYNRGCSYGEMGEFAKAVKDFTRVLELDGKYPGARTNLRFYSDKL